MVTWIRYFLSLRASDFNTQGLAKQYRVSPGKPSAAKKAKAEHSPLVLKRVGMFAFIHAKDGVVWYLQLVKSSPLVGSPMRGVPLNVLKSNTGRAETFPR